MGYNNIYVSNKLMFTTNNLFKRITTLYASSVCEGYYRGGLLNDKMKLNK